MAEHTVYKFVLLGDVGGTNIRLELARVAHNQNTSQLIKKDNLGVADYDVFEDSIKAFLATVKPQEYPQVAVIGIAGPVLDNTLKMANVQKWGLLDGNKIGTNLGIKHFQFINDFVAASYGILLVPPEDFVQLNGLPVNQTKIRGIFGPGTGLGNSILYPAKIKGLEQTFVLPSEGGHCDFPTIDEETSEFFKFMVVQTGFQYISLERSFCGPAIPHMFKFYSQKYPEDSEAQLKQPTAEFIVSQGVKENAPRIFTSVISLLLKIYSAAIGNFISHHCCLGGLYLIGSLTNSLIPKIKDVEWLADFNKRHFDIELTKITPVIVCKEIDLGLKGAFFAARKILQ